MLLASSNEKIKRGRKNKMQVVHPKLINVNHTITWYHFYGTYLLYFILVTRDMPQKSNLLFLQWTDLKNAPIAKEKKVEIMEAPQSKRFHGRMKFFTLWPTYIGEKGRILGKTYWIKVRCYWELGSLPSCMFHKFQMFSYTMSSFHFSNSF
jgi:hypothetical protein